jgi:hypothetical protein
MAEENDKGFFYRLGEILNAPLPGTQQPAEPGATAAAGKDDDSLMERIKDILNAPLPGTHGAESGDQASGSSPQSTTSGTSTLPRSTEPTPELDEDDLEEAWWKQDWSGFRAHQERERQGLELKQRRDQEKFAAYQQQEKQRFDGHQQQELEAFTRQQQWRLGAWKQAVANNPGQKPPPPPWNMPSGGQMRPPGPGGGIPGPMAGPPPWMQPPGPGRRRS